MIRSKHFWTGAILLAIIPILIIDISQHTLDWRKEVREEIISVAQNTYTFSRQQKAEILDRVFERNQQLLFYIYSKSFAIAVLLGLSFFLFRKYGKSRESKPVLGIVYQLGVIAVFLSVKIFLVNEINRNSKIAFLSLPTREVSFKKFYDEHFKGKVVYLDFWGTTCGPCLQEFRDFTKPLKSHYSSRQDIAWVYVSQGNRYLWKQQISKYAVEGYHVFLEYGQYEKLFRNSSGDSTEAILMPRYMILDKSGNVAVTNAKQPSDGDSLYVQLDKFLAIN